MSAAQRCGRRNLTRSAHAVIRIVLGLCDEVVKRIDFLRGHGVYGEPEATDLQAWGAEKAEN